MGLWVRIAVGKERGEGHGGGGLWWVGGVQVGGCCVWRRLLVGVLHCVGAVVAVGSCVRGHPVGVCLGVQPHACLSCTVRNGNWCVCVCVMWCLGVHSTLHPSPQHTHTYTHHHATPIPHIRMHHAPEQQPRSRLLHLHKRHMIPLIQRPYHTQPLLLLLQLSKRLPPLLQSYNELG